MGKGIFSDREKAMEASYFREQDAKLLQRLRANASLDDIAVALADKLMVDNPQLLARVRDLEITAETAPAFLLAPLVQVAWAEGSVSKQERETVLRLALERGVDAGSTAYERISGWLQVRPQDALFDAAYDVLQAAFAVLTLSEREDRVQRVIDACHKVAEASGSEIAKLMFLGNGVSDIETSMLEMIKRRLQSSI